MKPIWNKYGTLVGWAWNVFIFNTSFQPKGFVYNGGIFDFQRNLKGLYTPGIFRDTQMRAVAFLEGYAPGSTPPIPDPLPSTSSAPSEPTAPSQPSTPSSPSVPSGKWSSNDAATVIN